MKKLSKIEKKIWKTSFENDISNTPDIDKSWEIFQERLNNFNNYSKHSDAGFFKSFLSYFFGLRLSPNSVISFILIFIIFSPVAFNFLNSKTLKANRGCLESFILEDGSMVKLNSESKISYSSNFNKNNRDIKLNGEAYFEISDNEVPFKVNTDYGTIKVLGTSFNVRARPDGFEVGVVSGNVTVENKSQSINLKSGQKVDLDLSKPKKLNYQNYPGWKYETLVCDGMPLLKVSGEIERLFDISIKISNNQIEKTKISGILQTTNLQTVLSSISLLAQCQFKFDGETCTFF
tara:strand:- start:1114 stop:1986 length:873 start_codon:yes stop_codon:yes gene_type:complete